MSSRIQRSAAIAAVVFAGAAIAQTPTEKPSRIRGEIVSIDGDTMVVNRSNARSNADKVTIDVKPQVVVSAVKNVKLADIKPGAFVGTAATPDAAGKLTATEVLVFPEAARGSNEGHYPWDLSPTSTMTNANVDDIVQGTNGRDLKLSYKGGSKTVTVPENVPVVTFAPATRADLVAGKKVFVIATPGKPGQYTATRVVVEKDGVAPPM